MRTEVSEISILSITKSEHIAAFYAAPTMASSKLPSRSIAR